MAAFSVCEHLFVILLACVIVAGTARGASTGEDGRCRASCTNEDVCTFEFKVNIFASETGYFEVDGCDGTNPTLVMDANKLYVFSQADESNWMHPIGFGYMPDGALKDNPELEPGVNPYDSSCVSSLTCQHPRYFRDGKFLGSEEDAEDFGLDVYEPEFMFAREMWKEMGTYQVQLTITSSQTEDFFMFCHIHNLMSLRVKIADDGVLRSPDTDTPELGYEYETPTGLDESCGTSMINQYRNFTDVCQGMRFVCDADDSLFGLCMNALDCAMHIEMANTLERSNYQVTFFDQMIPHHINAVNMAKTTLKLVPDLDEETVDLMWSIINAQNMQVTYMRQQLDALGFDEDARRCTTTHCPVRQDTTTTPTPTASPSATPTPTPVCIDAAWVSGEHGGFEVHARDSYADVLCYGTLPCATEGHVVSRGGRLMTMAELCAHMHGSCYRKTMWVNGVQHRRSHLMPCDGNVCLTTLDNRVNSAWKRIENVLVHKLLTTRVPAFANILTWLQLRSTRR